MPDPAATAAPDASPAPAAPEALTAPRGGPGLRTLATLLVFVLSALLAVPLAALRGAQIEAEAQARAGALNRTQALGVAAAIDADLGRFGRQLQAQAALIERTGALRQPALLQALMDSVQAMPSYAWSGVTGADGRVLAALDGRLVGVDVSARDWWQAARAGLHYGDVHEARLLAGLMPALPSGEPWRFIDISVPLRDAARQNAGVLAVHLSWPWLRERIALFAGTAPAAQQAQLFIAGPDGRQRLGPGGEIGDVLPKPPAEGGEGWGVLAWPDGRRCVTAWAASPGSPPYAGLGWTLLVRTPLDALEAAQAGTRHWLWGTAALAVAAATALAWMLTTLCLLPLGQFVERARGIAAGAAPLPPPRWLPAELARLHAVVLALLAQLRQKEAALQASLEQVRGSLANVGRALPGMLFTRVQRGAEMRYSYVSESALHYLGVSREALLADRGGTLWLSRLDEADARRIGPLLQQTLDADAPLTLVFRVRGGDGCWRTLQATLVPREGGGAAQRVFDGIALDITALVEARTQALRAGEAKERFLATVSHELRTPLNGILGFAQLLEGRLEMDEDRQCAAHIRQAGRNLLRILNDVLDLSKIEAGRLELERLPLRVDEVAQACCELFAADAAAKGVALTLELPREPLPALLGDALRLQQVLVNLLSNAVKFTPHGHVTLAVRAGDEDAQGRLRLEFEVRDSGIGLTPQQLQRLFEPFSQAEASTARRFGGTGLGLWISRRLVQAMQGEIAVDSTPGQGTAVRVRLPLEPLAGAGARIGIGPFAEPDGTRPLRALVVDDVALNREVLRALLQLRGHRVEEVEGGEPAVRRVAEGGVDLVLMDMEMPGMDGLQAARAIRALHGAAARTPVWALSGRTFGHDVAQARAAGMDGHLAKPVDVAALDAVLAQATQARAQREGAAAQA